MSPIFLWEIIVLGPPVLCFLLPLKVFSLFPVAILYHHSGVHQNRGQHPFSLAPACNSSAIQAAMSSRSSQGQNSYWGSEGQGKEQKCILILANKCSCHRGHCPGSLAHMATQPPSIGWPFFAHILLILLAQSHIVLEAIQVPPSFVFRASLLPLGLHCPHVLSSLPFA